MPKFLHKSVREKAVAHAKRSPGVPKVEPKKPSKNRVLRLPQKAE